MLENHRGISIEDGWGRQRLTRFARILNGLRGVAKCQMVTARDGLAQQRSARNQ